MPTKNAEKAPSAEKQNVQPIRRSRYNLMLEVARNSSRCTETLARYRLSNGCGREYSVGSMLEA